jgi:hypothetical protein
MKKVYFVILATLTSAFLMGAADAPKVTVDSGQLFVSAKEVPISQVLEAIGEQTNIKFIVMENEMVEQLRVSEEFTNLPVELGIARLLKGFSYSVLRDEQSGAVKQVVILRTGTPDALTDNEPASSQLKPEPESHGSSALAADDRVEQAIDAALSARDPEEQVELLVELGELQQTRTLEVLTPLLHSKNAEVREATLEAMRWGTVQEASTLEEVRRLAAEDPDSQVRGAALEVLVRYDKSQEGRALLEKLAAAEGGDDNFRDFAKRHLQRMDAEAAASVAEDLQVNQPGE